MLDFIASKKHSAMAMACLLSGLVCMGLFPAAHAQEVVRAEAPSVQPTQPQNMVLRPALQVGEATRKLLEIQAQGVAASKLQYAMPVAVAEKVYQRYVDSFAHPIPEKLGSTMEQRQ